MSEDIHFYGILDSSIKTKYVCFDLYGCARYIRTIFAILNIPLCVQLYVIYIRLYMF